MEVFFWMTLAGIVGFYALRAAGILPTRDEARESVRLLWLMWSRAIGASDQPTLRSRNGLGKLCIIGSMTVSLFFIGIYLVNLDFAAEAKGEMLYVPVPVLIALLGMVLVGEYIFLYFFRDSEPIFPNDSAAKEAK